jgi:hypothetical protein
VDEDAPQGEPPAATVLHDVPAVWAVESASPQHTWPAVVQSDAWRQLNAAVFAGQPWFALPLCSMHDEPVMN